jgi:hypothetical protein
MESKGSANKESKVSEDKSKTSQVQVAGDRIFTRNRGQDTLLQSTVKKYVVIGKNQ